MTTCMCSHDIGKADSLEIVLHLADGRKLDCGHNVSSKYLLRVENVDK